MSEEKSVEAILDEAAEIRAEEAGISKAKAEDEGDPATPDAGGDAADTADDDEGKEQQASEGGDQDDSGEEAEAKPKPPSRAQKRIRQLTRERDEERRQRTQRDAEIRVLMAQIAQGQQQAKPNGQDTQEDAQPKQDDYQDYAQFIADTAAWAARQETRRAMQAQGKVDAEQRARSAGEQRQAVRASKARDLFARGEDAYEDFADLAGSEGLKITDAMTDAMIESDDGHKVLYHLGQNPEEAERIAGLNPVAQVRELAKLEVSITKPAAKKRTTRASEPIKPVKAGGAPGGFNPDECSMKEYMDNYHRERVAGKH